MNQKIRKYPPCFNAYPYTVTWHIIGVTLEKQDKFYNTMQGKEY